MAPLDDIALALDQFAESPPPELASGEPEPTSPASWTAFVEREVERVRTAYRAQPRFLLGHYRGEKQVADDYAGRELLELVQNAADAATEAGGKGRVRIVVTRSGLSVGNTGSPFRMGGVQSLMAVHASDKPGRNARLIGAKGLGFRALLNWSGEPVISSGALELAFNVAHAHAELEVLAKEEPEIARLSAEEDEPPAPTLAFPVTGTALEGLDGDSVALLEMARTMRGEGFDTVVTAAFRHDEAFERAVAQAAEFQPSFLLFTPSLVEIELQVEGKPTAVWRRQDEGGDVHELIVSRAGLEAKQRWICRRASGRLAGKGRKKRPVYYELAFALRIDQRQPAGMLHSYFPTSIPLPFPGLFHATLELDSNRKAFKAPSDVNIAVLKALAVHYAQSLSELAVDGRVENPLDFLSSAAPFPEALKDFENAVYEAAGALPLIPDLSGRRSTAAQVRIGPLGYQTFLPSRLFGHLASCRDVNDREVLRRLQVETLDAVTVVKDLRTAELTLDERARVIVGVARNLPAVCHHPGLLLDQLERPLTPANTAFPPPSGDERAPRLPDWARARFILPELWTLISRHALATSPRELARQLAGFGVTEYSNESVINSLRGQAAKALQSRRDPDAVQRELLSALVPFFSPTFRPPPGTFKVKARDGVWRDARELHLSADYGQTGRIVSALFADQPGALLAGLADNGLTDDLPDATGFFRWLGVNAWPRTVSEPVSPDQRRRVIDALPDSVTFGDASNNQIVNRASLSFGYNLSGEVRTIEGLSKILETAPSEAILAWLAQDLRFDPAISNAFPMTLSGRKDGKANFKTHSGPLPDLVRARIAETAWVLGRDGLKHRPVDCMANPGGLRAVFRAPAPPSEEAAARLGLTTAMWRQGLERAGAPLGLADLSAAQLLDLLIGLPDRNLPSGVVRHLYMQILELDAFDPSDAPAGHARFLSEGRVQAFKGRTAIWTKPSEALYADRDGLPQAARDHLALIDLPSRRNSKQVLARFGVSPLSKRRFDLKVTAHVEETSIVAGTLRSTLVSARPFISALRRAQSHDQSALKRFERLTLVVSRSVDIEIEIGEARIPTQLDVGAHALQGDQLFIVLEPLQDMAQTLHMACEPIADGIAELFEVQTSPDFAKLLKADSDGLRRRLLARTLPNLTEAEFELLLGPDAEDDFVETVQVTAEMLAKGPAGAPLTPPASGSPSPAAPSPTTVPPAAPVAPTVRPTAPIALTSTPVEPVIGSAGRLTTPTVPKAPRIRVSRMTGALGGEVRHDPWRAGDAEAWAVLFEESEGRFPYSVAHLQGPDAYGCDCLSFESEEKRAAFMANPRDTDLISRFIEVKSGQVRLEDSQVRAAEARRKRYFVYKIEFYSGSREFADLNIVSDPLSRSSALVMEHQLRVEAVTDREQFRLTPDSGDTETV